MVSYTLKANYLESKKSGIAGNFFKILSEFSENAPPLDSLFSLQKEVN